VKTGIVIFAHGSSVESANGAVRAVAAGVARQGGFELVEAAFLEGGRPQLAEAVASLAAQGAARVLVVPYFLTLGLHLQRDLPRIVADIARIQSNVEVRVTPPLDGHPAMIEALIDRARDGEKAFHATADDNQARRDP
jgi:sirohydrochlorin ferrochelatase